MNLYPALLTDNLRQANQYLGQLEQCRQKIKTIHLDIIDGNFADNLTWTPIDLQYESLPTNWRYDFHFMVDEPMDYLLELEESTAHIGVRAAIGQLEKMSHQVEFLQAVKKRDWLAGLAIDLFTPLEEIEMDSWLTLDVILLMGVEAGFAKQKINERIFDKIKTLKSLLRARNLPIEIVVDGGVKLNNYRRLLTAGAQGLVVNSQIWADQKSPCQVIKQFLDK